MLQKFVVIYFAQAVLVSMGDMRKVIGFYPTKLIIPTFQRKFMDGVLELEDGTLLNLEFQTGNITEDFILRCAQYAVNLRVVSGRHVETKIISTGLRIDSEKLAFISREFKFQPEIFFYSEFDGLEILNTIKDKLKNNIKLNELDHYHLILIPLMGNINKIEAAFEVFEIVDTDGIFTKDEQSIIKQAQYIVADIIADGDDELFKKFMDVIVVSPLLTEYLRKLEMQIYEDIKTEAAEKGLEDGLKEGRKEGLKEGRKAGIKEAREDVARNLKDILSDDEISVRTGLELEVVKNL